MMQAVILKCPPNGRYHLGETTQYQNNSLSDTATLLHSDVLFSAFLSNLSAHYPDQIDTFIGYFNEGKLRFSSGFYCIENTQTKQYVYLLPKPINLNLQKTDSPKKLKKIQFISLGVWQKGLLPDAWLDESQCSMPDTNYVVLKEELKTNKLTLFQKTDSLKVQVRTPEEEGNLYTQTDLMLIGDEIHRIHWYFLLEQNIPPAAEEIVKDVLENLSGIGGERSTGCGVIAEVLFENFQVPALTEKYVSLSLTIPQKAEEKAMLCYQTKLRGGMFLSNNYRLKVVQMLAEGAIQSQHIQGSLVEIGEKRLRCGINFSLPLPDAYHINLPTED